MGSDSIDFIYSFLQNQSSLTPLISLLFIFNTSVSLC